MNFDVAAYESPEFELLKLTPENAASIQLISTFEAQGLSSVEYISFSQGGKTISLAKFKPDTIAEIWSIYSAPALLSTIRTDATTPVGYIQMSNTGKFAFVDYHADNDIVNTSIFNTTTGELIVNFGKIYDQAFNPQDTLVALSTFSETTPEETVTIIWDLTLKREIRRYEYPLTGSLAFSPDGNLLAIAGADQTVSVFDLALPASDSKVMSIDHNSAYFISDLRFIFQTHVAFISNETDYATVYTWNLVNKTNVYKARVYSGGLFLANNRAFVTQYRTDGGATRVLEFWSLWNGIKIGEVAAYGDINPDTSLIMGIEGELSLYSIATGKKLFKFPHCSDECGSYFNPDGKTVLIHYGKTVEVWGVPET